MPKYLLIFFWGVLMIILSINCVSVSPDETEPVGAVKVSYFAMMEGRMSQKSRGNYFAVISKEWAKQNKRRLNEPFEKLKLPPVWPVVKIASNSEIRELVNLIRKEGFYSLTPTNLDHFTIDEMERSDFRTKVLTVEIDGLARCVAIEDLSPEQSVNFRKIRDIFLSFFITIESPFTKLDVEGNWRKILEQQPPRKK